MIVKDIEDRQARKESDPSKRKITDIALLKTIAKYLASVVGNPVSVRSITDYLSSNGRKISPNTAVSYTHLDVYKRQVWSGMDIWTFSWY